MRALIPGELGGNQVLDLIFSQLAASKSGGHTVLTMEKVIILVVSHTVNMDFVFCQWCGNVEMKMIWKRFSDWYKICLLPTELPYSNFGESGLQNRGGRPPQIQFFFWGCILCVSRGSCKFRVTQGIAAFRAALAAAADCLMMMELIVELLDGMLIDCTCLFWSDGLSWLWGSRGLYVMVNHCVSTLRRTDFVYAELCCKCNHAELRFEMNQ